MIDLSGKIALITGASGAIGGAIAKILYQQGAEIIISGTRQESLEELKNSFQDQKRCHVISCNLSDPEAPEDLISQAEKLGSSVDILVNNAGITRDGLMMRMKDEDWQKVLDVNLTAVFRLIRASLRSMMKKRWGRIINVTSIVGVTGNPGQSNYAASKAGLIGMTKSLAEEIASRQITVNCVAPGFIVSPMTDVLNDEQKQRLVERIPTQKMGSPEDIAFAVAFLASQEAGYITGQTLHINGGMVMI